MPSIVVAIPVLQRDGFEDKFANLRLKRRRKGREGKRSKKRKSWGITRKYQIRFMRRSTYI